MARFKVGDRVQLVGDIARFYARVVGVIVDSDTDPGAALAQYQVRLSDETVATFFDFQLQAPQAVRAQIIFDSLTSPQEASAGVAGPRRIHLVAAGVEIHLKVFREAPVSMSGQVSMKKAPACGAVVSLMINDVVTDTKATDPNGQFEFREMPAGELTLEAVLPGKRILAPLNI